MRRTSLAALFMAAAVIASCSKEEEKSPEIIIERESVTLTSGDEFLINATSDYDLTFKSEDEYHAKVDEKGLVTATYVGETNIVVSNTEKSKKVKITVRPEYDLYNDPSPYLGKTKSQVISKFGEPQVTTDDAIKYSDYSYYATSLMFLFENDVVKSIYVTVEIKNMSKLVKYLDERYVYVGQQNDIYSYVNNVESSKITALIAMTMYKSSYMLVMYGAYKS